MHIFKALTTLAALAGSVFAQELDFPGLEEVSKGPKPQVSAELVSDTAEIAPGTAFTVAVKFEHKPKWHTYWTNTGSIQLPPEITWTLPKGFTAAKPEFGVPEIKQDGAETRYVFGGTSYILVKITSPATLPTTGSSEIAFSGRYQFCEDGGSCKMSKPQDNPKLTLPHAAAAKPNAEVSAELQAYKAKHFAKPLTQFTAKAYQLATGYAVYFTGTGEVPAAAQFLVSKAKIADAATPAVISPGPNGFLISLKAHEEMDAENKPTQIDGVLVIGDEKFAVQAPIVAGEPPVAAPASSGGQGGKSLGFILWSAFLGGLILNLMPCVFPVIGLKIMDFVKQSGEDSFKVKLHGMSFSFGILVTFMALALATILLKGSWGFQLQNPWVVYVILFIMFVFGMNMYGVFEIGTGAMGVGQGLSAKRGYLGSFFKGALAVVVSTPCSAPFLATALSAVLTMPKEQIFLIYAFIALGLASPYLILTSSPALLKKLPKPGAWMESFKQVMSFLMFATAGFLLWTYQGLVDEGNGLAASIALAVVGLGLYIHGRWNTPISSRKTRTIATVLALLFAVGGFYLGAPQKNLKWQAWSPELEKELLAAGKPVYIDFTARWCATCQTNKISYKNADVKAAVNAKGIQLLKADWTDQNDLIRKELEKHYNKNAIPVNVLLIPGNPEPIVLPELLTSGTVLGVFEKVPGKE